jgi:hypothetical protein
MTSKESSGILDSGGLDDIIKKNCRGDCVVISNRKITDKEELRLIDLIGKEHFDKLNNILKKVSEK